jgi:peptidyl-prolyl cis-trans isomerase B (cyclophilin B)
LQGADTDSRRRIAALILSAGMGIAILLIVAITQDVGPFGDDDVDEPGGAAQGVQVCEEVPAPEPKQVELERPSDRVDPGENLTAAVETNCGTFEIALASKGSPKTVSSFVHMAEEGLYDGTPFHRVVPDFVIQGGDPTGEGMGGPGYSIDEPPPSRTVYTRGTVAMAKTGTEPPGRSGSQFFVVTAPADAGLPPDYAILGEVSSGEDVVESIAALADPTLGPAGGEPTQPVVIERVTIQ